MWDYNNQDEPHGLNFGNLLRHCRNGGWGNFEKYEPKGNNIVANGGKADFKSVYGTNFTLKVEDISHGMRSSQVVRKVKVPIKRVAMNG